MRKEMKNTLSIERGHGSIVANIRSEIAHFYKLPQGQNHSQLGQKLLHGLNLKTYALNLNIHHFYSSIFPSSGAFFKLQFRESVSDVLLPKHDEAFLLRWLRARNLEPEKAEKMLRASLDWRKRMNVDKILTDYVPCEVLQKYSPYGYSGYEKDGCPIWIIPFGHCDVRGLLHSVKKSEIIMAIVQVLERSEALMAEQTKKLGRPIVQQYVIVDLEDFGIRHFTWKPALELIRSLITIYDSNYPETLKRCMLINAPKIFTMAFALVKPFIHETTLRKICIYGKDGWREILKQDIAADQFPEHWGGSQNDGDPRCPKTICPGGEVPQSYYMAPASRLAEEKGTNAVTVGKSGNFIVDMEVAEAGTVLKWLFQTEDNDIGFSVSFKAPNGTKEEIIPKERINCHMVPEDGMLTCLKPGTYEFTFDNSYSYLRSKKLVYKLESVSADKSFDDSNGAYDWTKM